MKYLDRPTTPIEVKDRSIKSLTDAMKETGFQGRKLGEAVDIWASMLEEEDMTIFMGLSGAMVPAGMRKIISFFIKTRMIDCLVSTGANIFHDIHEAMGGKHYKGTHNADDHDLLRNGIDRIYDVFSSEDRLRETDRFIARFAKTLDEKTEYSSREFMYLLGKKISEDSKDSREGNGERNGEGNGERDKDSIVISAYENNVPVFVPALGDSSIGIGLALARREGCNILVNQIKDVDEITRIIEQSEKTGVIYIGGGVPKNFIQQTEIILSILDQDRGGHDYAIQFTTDTPQFGGLSGCTFEEGISWGKISARARKVQVFVDCTIALPVVSHALFEKAKGLKRDAPVRHLPRFDTNLSIED